ncbi:hypothetical protein MD484_g1291, partial [Candolleomyces efflorescens]
MLLKAFLRLLFVLNRRIFRECIRAVYLPLRTTIGPETSENTSILFELFSDTQWLLETLRVDVKVEYPPADLRQTCEVHIGYLKALKAGAEDEKVVVKALRMPKSPQEDPNKTAACLTRKIVRECFVWSLVEHEYICPFRGLGQLKDFQLPALVSAHVPNECLAYISHHPGHSFSVVLETANGMKYLHEIGIVHGDVKPDNIMINENGRVQIIDFGLSKFQPMSGFTTTHEGHRCPRYCAPELLRQEQEEGFIKPTFESDVFGFAMAVLEILSWDGRSNGSERERKPYNHIPADLALWSMLTDGTTPVERPKLDRYPNVPSAFHALIRQCWEEEPSSRFSMAEVVDRLGRLERSRALNSLAVD